MDEKSRSVEDSDCWLSVNYIIYPRVVQVEHRHSRYTRVHKFAWLEASFSSLGQSDVAVSGTVTEVREEQPQKA